jgi:predicted dienelactone hydrolase
MRYDPFARGPLTVGVRTGAIVDAARDRRLVYEVWYPAAARRGQSERDSFAVPGRATASQQQAARDAAALAGPYPLVAFSHSSYGDRRQSSFLTTHLASHGYVVVAADHAGNAASDFAVRQGTAAMTPDELDAYIARIIEDRVPDLRALIDRAIDGGMGEPSAVVDRDRIGLVGWSFGGWSVLAAPEQDERIAAVVAMAPAGSSRPLPGIIPATLTFAWSRAIATLVLTGDADRFTPLTGVRDVFARAPSPKRMFVLRGGDHGHFADDVDPTGPTREQAHLFTRGLALAHLDAAVKDEEDAGRYLERDVSGDLRGRGLDAFADEGVAQPAG